MSVIGLLLLLFLSLYGFSQTTYALRHQRVRPNGMAILSCGDLKAGKVTWSRDIQGLQVSVLSTNNGETIRHMNNNSYSSLPDLSLIIWFVSSWDEGLYYCNGTLVACLTVKPADGQNTEDLTKCAQGDSSGVARGDVKERVLMFGGVGLAALMFLFATGAAVKAVYARQRAHTTDNTHTLQTDQNYVNLREL